MPRTRRLFLILATVVTFALTGAGTAFASGSIVFDGSPGTGPPPATLGGYGMTPFGADAQPFGVVGGVAGPTGTVSFSPSLDHTRIGVAWATWSHGYAGDVYPTDGALSATLTLPPGASAFYLYAEPDPFAVFDITAVSQDGTSSGPIAVDGFAGAQYFGFYSTGSDTIASITISSAVDFAIGEFGISGGAAQTKYVALGDSYSSGEGNPPFFAGTDGPDDYCHRSPQAYSEVLGASLGVAPLFYACSGAVTSDLTSTFHQTEPPQLTRPGVDSTADLVTMTIGGNDAGFADTLKACISQKLKADAFNAAIGPVARWLGLGKDPSCANSDSFTSSVDTRIANIFWPVKTTYLSVKSSVDPVNTSIMAADYPLLFPASHDDQNCLSLSIILTNDDMDWMDGEGGRLDALLQQAAGEAGINFVDVRGWFAGHEICGPDGSYINGLSTASGSGGGCTWSVLGHCIIPGIPVVGSFHPNSSGHANGYAAAFASAISSAVDRTPAGFPANPFPLPDPPATTVKPAVGTGPLDAQPVSSGGGGVATFAATATAPVDDCAGTYQAGQQVAVAGDGFVPGTTVTVYVTSPGPSSNGEFQLASLKADANGHIAMTVRIPVSATGFTQPGAAAGNVFLDAIGLGSAITHLDDVAMIGLAPHTSSCGTVETLTFSGFSPPISNPPAVNKENSGRTIPVKFSVPGANGALADVLAAGYPQSAPVTCSAPEPVTTGDPTGDVGNPGGSGDDYHYNWKTDKSWHGCRSLILKLVDGSYHRAVFDFGK